MKSPYWQTDLGSPVKPEERQTNKYKRTATYQQKKKNKNKRQNISYVMSCTNNNKITLKKKNP